MNQYMNGPQQPYPPQGQYPQYPPQYPPSGYQQPPRELARARSVQGTLVVTDHLIQVGRLGRQQSLARSSLVGVDYRLTLLFPFLSRATLVFHGSGGERVRVTSLPAGKARQIKRLLGY